MKLVIGVIVVGVAVVAAYAWNPAVVTSALVWASNKVVAAWEWLKAKTDGDDFPYR